MSRYIVLVVCLSCFLLACKQSNPTAELDIQLQNTKAGDQIMLLGPGLDKDLVLNNGKVLDTIQLDKPGVYSIRVNRNVYRTWLKPGDKLSFSADAKQPETSAKFDDAHHGIYQYFKAKDQKAQTSLSYSKLIKMEPAAFESHLSTTMDSLNALATRFDLPPALLALEKEDLNYLRLRQMYNYPSMVEKSREDLPASFQDVVAGIDLNDESKFKHIQNYSGLVNDVVKGKIFADTTDAMTVNYLKAMNALPKGYIRDELIHSDIWYLLGPDAYMDDVYNFYKNEVTNPEYMKEVELQYKDFLPLKKGNVSPSFNYENIKGGKTSLADLKGKYVYIDVWATWCGPCKFEIPFLKDKEKKYHGKNIEFVSISVDSKRDYDKWKKMVKDQSLGGVQLFADNAWRSEFVQAYKIKGIPRFILVDPAGKIVTASAPKPSEKEFDRLMQRVGL